MSVSKILNDNTRAISACADQLEDEFTATIQVIGE